MKQIICLLLALSIAFSFVGCKLDLSDWLEEDTVSDHDRPRETKPPKDDEEDPEKEDADSADDPKDEDTDPTDDPKDEDTLPPERPADPTQPTSPPADELTVVKDLEELRDYLNAEKEQDHFEVSFVYKGTKALNASMLAQMTSACYIYLSYHSGQRYTVNITEYPGDRIVDAYFRNDTSTLTSDERKVLRMAMEMVKEAQKQADSALEMEILLHDMLVDHITYLDGIRDFSDPNNPPRILTAIGAFLDGKANCQGYADAFYVLGSIAGFQVGRMNVETPDDLHVTNTICINNKWYIVDVTFDDVTNSPHNYRLFNAGLDMISEYTWAYYKEIHPIEERSSSNYYYYYCYDSVYDDVEDMAEYIVEQWDDCGQTTVHAMLNDETDGMVLDDVLYDALMDTGKYFSYIFWYYYTDHAIYYTVVFE